MPNMIYGVMAGVNVPKLTEKDGLMDISNRLGFGFGMMWGVDFGRVELVPEIWYTRTNVDMMVVGSSESYSMGCNNIEVPILVAIPFGAIRLNFGPTLSLVNNSTLQEVDGDESIDFGRTRSTVGYLVGASCTFNNNMIIDLRLSGGLKAVEMEWYKGNKSYNYNFFSCGLNVGYRF